jgi:hypothetical protein
VQRRPRAEGGGVAPVDARREHAAVVGDGAHERVAQAREIRWAIASELLADLLPARLDGAGQECDRLRLAERAAQLGKNMPVHQRPVLECGVQLAAQAIVIRHQARSST